MPKYKMQAAGITVDLTDKNFKAKGGEGSIYVIGDKAFKVCDPGKMIDIRKLTELQALTHVRIIKPDDILEDAKGRVVGYTMRTVPGNAVPLAQILSKTYREREGVTPDMMAALVKQIAEGVRHIHSKPGYLQVDGNEFNYMVTDDHKNVYFIDVNSFQTPSFPADAIMASIRDWSAGTNFTHLTDWYSFAIISWYMFTGIHAFKGRHPRFPNVKTAMVDQMTAGVSILDPETQFPQAAVYFPFENFVPGGKTGAFMQWYRAVFVDGKRLPAPSDFQAVVALAAAIKEIVGSNNFDITELRQYAAAVTGYVERGGREIVVTADGYYVDNQPNPKLADKVRYGFSPVTNTPVALALDADVSGLMKATELPSGRVLFGPWAAEDIMAYDGRLFCLSGGWLSEITYLEVGGSLNASLRMLAEVLPNATKLYNGVAIQDMYGARMVSVFPEAGHHRQFKMDELVGYEITEAKFDKGVLMVVGMEKGEGSYTRFVFRFAADWSGYDVRKIDNITPTGINFTVLDNGVAVCITEEEKVEIFQSKKDAAGIKVITDPAIKANMRLCHRGSQVRFAHGDKMYSFAVRKTP